jgi:hypothetical protein
MHQKQFENILEYQYRCHYLAEYFPEDLENLEHLGQYFLEDLECL